MFLEDHGLKNLHDGILKYKNVLLYNNYIYFDIKINKDII